MYFVVRSARASGSHVPPPGTSRTWRSRPFMQAGPPSARHPRVLRREAKLERKRQFLTFNVLFWKKKHISSHFEFHFEIHFDIHFISTAKRGDFRGLEFTRPRGVPWKFWGERLRWGDASSPLAESPFGAQRRAVGEHRKKQWPEEMPWGHGRRPQLWSPRGGKELS